MHNDIGHLRRRRNHDAQAFEVGGFEMQELALRIADVNDRRARREARTKFLDGLFDERILSARRESHRFARRQFHRDARQIALALDCLTNLRAVRQILLQLRRPRLRSERAHQRQRGWFDLINGLAAVRRTARIVRVSQQQAGFDEVFHGLVANRLARVRRISDAVGFRDELNDGRDATERT